MIRYAGVPDDLRPDQLTGFFVGWPSPPSPQAHVELLKHAQHAVLAFDGDRVVGFVTALSDGVFSAYLPLLEVLPKYKWQGIGGALVRRVVGEIGGVYSIDVVCDDDVVPFYERFGFQRVNGMVFRPRGIRQTGSGS
ncbi:GNAT family N-acetyltransferase [Lentzea tibetensis]|uniref:GNAT family N-acetyltransferase n=1 Tax=Lentzea tibetensis TaxID=2591470 RepID=A0A563ENQ6_9PSEU|nr:GNAT family N-acetyltransferase [Lentzea tibetensis]TWP48895.1 GNAT family N-acetyltransferase [Lentzea tibetensis]